ncbi:MAG: hypothetical protein KF858_05390 [Candidatus Sumerlaeia bacterium]|nr:hypothetical protein [Candidatus Sumerlaeia bacterium]
MRTYEQTRRQALCATGLLAGLWLACMPPAARPDSAGPTATVSMAPDSGTASLLPAGVALVRLDAGEPIRRLVDALIERRLTAGARLEAVAMPLLLAEISERPTWLALDATRTSAVTTLDDGRRAVTDRATDRALEATWLPVAEASRGLWLGEVRASAQTLMYSRVQRSRPTFLIHDDRTGALLTTTDRTLWLGRAEQLAGKPLVDALGFETAGPVPAARVEALAAQPGPIAFDVDVEALLRALAARDQPALLARLLARPPAGQFLTGTLVPEDDAVAARIQRRGNAPANTPALLRAEPPVELLADVPGDCVALVTARLESLEALYDVWLNVLGQGDRAAITAAEREADAFFGFPVRQSLLARLGPSCLFAARGTGPEAMQVFFVSEVQHHESIDRLFLHMANRFGAEVSELGLGDSTLRSATFPASAFSMAWHSNERRLLLVLGTRPVRFSDLDARPEDAALWRQRLSPAGDASAQWFVDLEGARTLLVEPAPPRPFRNDPPRRPLPTARGGVRSDAEGVTVNVRVDLEAAELLDRVLPAFSLAPRFEGIR